MSKTPDRDMSDEDETSGTFGDWVVDRSVRALIWTARCLPYTARVPFFGWINRRVIVPLAGYQKRMLENLSYVLPELDEATHARIAAQAADNVGRLLIETYSGPDFITRAGALIPHGPGLRVLEEARASGRPVILLTGHFGNYEAARAAIVDKGYSVGGLYRPMANPYFNAHYAALFEAICGPIFPQGRQGLKGMLRHLSKGGMLMMLNDLYVGSGQEMEFVDKPAMTSTNAAEMALRYNAALLPVYGIRNPDGISFDVVIEDEIPHTDAETMTLAFNASISARIRAHPGQWFWIHRRWKRKWRKGKGVSTDEPMPAAIQPRRKYKG